MPISRRVPGFSRRYMLTNLLYVLPGAGFFYLMVRNCERFRCAWFWVGLVGFAICLATGIVLDFVRLRRFRCPQCGDILPNPSRKPGDPIQYICAHCNITWDTGLCESDG